MPILDASGNEIARVPEEHLRNFLSWMLIDAKPDFEGYKADWEAFDSQEKEMMRNEERDRSREEW